MTHETTARDLPSRAERHRAELRVHCYRMVGSHSDAEDLVQETMIRAWRKRESLDDPERLRPWLYRIATRVCLDFLAGPAREREVATAASASRRAAPTGVRRPSPARRNGRRRPTTGAPSAPTGTPSRVPGCTRAGAATRPR